MRLIDIKRLRSGDSLDKPYFTKLHESNRVNSLEVAGEGRLSKSTMGSIMVVERTRARRGGTDYQYLGPFAVVEKTATSVTILGYHADEDRNWRNYIDVGLATPLELGEQDLAVAMAGWAYMILTQTSRVYNAVTAAFAATLPAQDNTHVYIRLAWVDFANGAITGITQWRYPGNDYPGRVF